MLHPHYIAGFVDGEGCFTIAICNHKGCKFGLNLRVAFNIGLNRRDSKLLLQIRKHLGGIGSIHYNKDGTNQIQWYVEKIDELENLVEFFERYPLQGAKAKDFNIWKKAVALKRANYGQASQYRKIRWSEEYYRKWFALYIKLNASVEKTGRSPKKWTLKMLLDRIK